MKKQNFTIKSTLPHVKTLLLWSPTLFPQKLKTATLLLLRKTKRAVVTVFVAQNQSRRCNGYCCAKTKRTVVTVFVAQNQPRRCNGYCCAKTKRAVVTVIVAQNQTRL